MRQFFILFLLSLLIAVASDRAYAGVAEASTGASSGAVKYDMSGLDTEEQEWFLTFLEGTFFADGWDQISIDILGHVPPEDREHHSLMLTQLGNKIGREWCKDNDVRKIDNSKLKKWGRWLKTTASEKPEELPVVIQNIDGEVESLLD